MGKRKSLSKRVRFEIFKRDGFRCQYCGAGVQSSALHVDHVVPVAKGGRNDPENLVTACAACNGGKSDVPLGEMRYENLGSEILEEHAEQLRTYLASVHGYEQARVEVREFWAEQWRQRIGEDPFVYMVDRLVRMDDPMEMILEAMSATGRKDLKDTSACKYFHAVLKKMRRE